MELESNKLHTPTRTRARKGLMLGALAKCAGSISDAAKMSGVSRRMHYNWYKDDEQYREQVDDIQEENLDFARAKLNELIEGVLVIDNKNGEEYYLCRQDDHGSMIPVFDNPIKASRKLPCYNSIALMLRSKGKHRGWTERHEPVVKTIDRVVFVEV